MNSVEDRVAGGAEALTSVSVDLGSGSVTVVSEEPVDAAAVKAAIEEAGYELTA
jgi:copper chaperone